MNIRITIVLAGFFSLFLTLNQAVAEIPQLPLSVPDKDWQPLYNSVDPALQKALEKSLNKNRAWKKLVAAERMAVGIVDLSDSKNPRFARVNGRVMMYAASLPKIAILLAAYACFDDGSLEETPEIHQDLADMIRTSSNSAATRMIDRIGFDKIESVLTDPRYKLYDTEKGGGLWVGKRYAKEGERIPDPIAGLSHGATVTQICRFYYLLATGQIINPERSRQMLEDLSDPGIHHKFVNILENNVSLERVFRKSGTWKTYHCDSVLVWGDVWRRYILTAIVESKDGEKMLRDIVPLVEDLLRLKAYSGKKHK
jgi:beta-lactamase class A